MDENLNGAYGAGNNAPPPGGAPQGQKPQKPPKPPKTKEQLDWEAARKDYFNKTVWTPWLHPIIALVAICLATSLLLGLTNELTAPRIAQNVAAEADAVRIELLPEADGFEAVAVDDSLSNVTAIYKATNGAGWVIEAWGQGYGGQVPAMVAFDAAGTIIGVQFMENNETPGLGKNLETDPSFAAQFAGRGAQSVSLGDVDKIASATISTGAAINAVNAAIAAYNLQVGGAPAVTLTPEEVRASLLPGESLTPITISAANVQPTAYVSNAGNFIIYGEKPSEREGSDSVVVAAVAMDAEGRILNLWIDTSGESEQYGATLAGNKAFHDSFIGLSAPVEVDVIADITNSSRSVMEAVNTALAALPLAQTAGGL